MTDIVERLDNLIECEMDRAQCELYRTAKTEIEWLRHDWAVACKDLGEARAEVERLRALALKFLNEQTDENAAAMRAALEPKP